MKEFTIILIFLFSVRINGLNSSRFYNKYLYDDYDEYENKDYDSLTNIFDDEQESSADDMYESDIYYYRHKSLLDKKYLKDHTLEVDAIADENWPYPEEDEIGFNRTISSKFVCEKCACGERINTRIIGGSPTIRRQFPWMVMLSLNNRFICGASLINSKYILTAAHCFAGFKLSSLSATFRVLKRSNFEIAEKAFIRKLERYWIHSRYNRRTMDYDIALSRLKNTVNSFKLLNPICLPPKRGSWGGNGEKGEVSGWGDTTVSPLNQITADQLKKVTLPILTNRKCEKLLSIPIKKRMICAGGNFKSACKGDSGGALVVNYSGIISGWQQLGIVSWGIGCGRNPTVFTKVPKFINWIKNKANVGACWCHK